jgi:hypothetical protein
MTEIGTAADAFEAYATYHHAGDARQIGRGEDRTAYLINGVVYKIGHRQSANRYDHDTLSTARAAGARWAPESALYTVVGMYDETWTVMAMPYLVDDGTDADPEALAEMHAQTGGGVDRIGGNYVVIASQPVVIDGCTVALAGL